MLFASILFITLCSFNSNFKLVKVSTLDGDFPLSLSQIEDGSFAIEPEDKPAVINAVLDQLPIEVQESWNNRLAPENTGGPSITDIQLCPGSGVECSIAKLLDKLTHGYFDLASMTKGKGKKDILVTWSDGTSFSY